MKLTFLGKTGGSQGGNCPALYSTDRGTFVVQGKLVTDPAALEQLRDVLDDETCVEVPADVFHHLPADV
jgi:hypothetical protein